MSRIVVKFDGQRKPVIVEEDTGPYGADVYFVFGLDEINGGIKVEIPDIHFGVRLIKDAKVIKEHLFPSPGVKYVSSDQKYLECVRLAWTPNESYTIQILVKEFDGPEWTESNIFTTPTPLKPYPSWAWNDTAKAWDSPKPPPIGEVSSYGWDEANLSWDKIDETETAITEEPGFESGASAARSRLL